MNFFGVDEATARLSRRPEQKCGGARYARNPNPAPARSWYSISQIGRSKRGGVFMNPGRLRAFR